MVGFYCFLRSFTASVSKTFIISSLVALLAPVASAQVNFNKPDFDTAKGPVSVAAADFNRDGLLDVVTANSKANSITVLLNNGNGTFGRRTDYPAGKNPAVVVTGDFNNDGIADVAVANQDDNTISIFLGNGDGTLRSVTTIPVGTRPDALITADFNKDGKADLAVVNLGNNNFSVFLGNGDGTFAHNADYSAGPDSSVPPFTPGIVAADFNGDGILDLAVTNGASNTASIYLGNGNGTFRLAGSFTIQGDEPTVQAGRMVAADFNQDGKIDLLVHSSNCDSRRLCHGGAMVFAGQGNGTFDQGHAFPLNSATDQPMIGVDLNGDHVPDIVTATDVVLVNPATVFTSGSTSIPMFQAGEGTLAGTGGDFTGDGKADVVVANFLDNTVSLLQGNGDGTFHQLLRYPFPDAGGVATGIITADFNRDGVPDVVVNDRSTAAAGRGLWLFLGNSDGTLRAPVQMSGDMQVFSTAVADVNCDGNPDIVVHGTIISSGRTVIRVFLGNGDGTFRAPIDTGTIDKDTTPIANGGLLQIADFNGDGIPDAALRTVDASTNTPVIAVHFGVGDGSFLPKPVETTIPGALEDSWAAGDFNRDGKMDLVVGFGLSNGSTDSFTIYLGNGDGTFRAGQTNPATQILRGIATADLNHDGFLDLAVAHNAGVAVWLGNGDGTFTQKADLPTFPSAPLDVQIADVNGDGRPDIVVSDEDLSIFPGNGDGTFQPRQDFPIGFAFRAAFGDLNRDGALDIMVASRGSLSLMLSGNGPPLGRDFHLSLNPSLVTAKAGQSATATVSVAAIGNFTDAVAFSCMGLPAGAACSFNPSGVNGGANANSTLTISTTARTSGALVPLGNGTVAFALGLPVCGIVIAGLRRRNRWKFAMIFALLLLGLLLFQGCGGLGSGGGNGNGGGGGGGGGGTPSGTFNVTVIGTSGGSPVLTHSQTLTLNVQ